MISNPFFLASVLLNVVLAFLTATFVIEAFLLLFRIKGHRARASFRLFPFVCVIMDRVFNEFSMVNWLNPLSCNSCVQKLFLQVFFPQLKTHLSVNEVTLTNHLAANYTLQTSKVIFYIFLSITAFLVLRKLCQIAYQNQLLRLIIQRGEISERPMDNIPLSKTLTTHQVKIVVSDEIDVPMALHSRVILMPRKVMDVIMQEEFFAILAHEFEHLRWRDPYTRLFSQLVSSLFWWVPTRWWMKKVIQDQEMACDHGTLNYGLPKEALATAIVKVSRKVKLRDEELFCAFTDKVCSTKARLQEMLGLPTTKEKLLRIGLIGIVIEVLILVLCLSGK